MRCYMYVFTKSLAYLVSSASFSDHALDLLWLAVLAPGAGSTVGIA